ncbi:response regulator [Alsobacter soli]|uniref:Response regulator n=1 Tax=Alsobacter soli TaxID=2109933 RepID=A0A2T1HNP8_9HYPH|nr:response regulator [Alsobacter soli]PSC03262.1 response regulator [Alsobacter soli]
MKYDARATRPVSAAPKRVLVVDDDPTFCKIALRAFTDEGTEVVTAADGLRAIERLRPGQVDLLVVDLEMPGADGFSVIKHVRSTEGLTKLPVIVITGKKSLDAIDTVYRLGANSYVTKPVNWALLPYKVKDTLAKA